MPFWVVSGVGREIGVLDGDEDRRREGAVLGEYVTNWDFVAYSLP